MYRAPTGLGEKNGREENGRSEDRPFLFYGAANELLGAFVFWGGFLQGGEEDFCAWEHGDGVLEDDVFRADGCAIEFLVAVVVGTEGGAFERDARKEAAGAGVGEDFGAEGDVAFGGSGASDGTGGGGC